MTEFNFVTSLNKRLYAKYGERFIKEFFKFNSDEISLSVVFEDGIPEGLGLISGLNCLELHESNHHKFKRFFGKLYEANGYRVHSSKLPNGQIKPKIMHDWKFDALRFSFKIFSLILFKEKEKKSLPFAWIDADVRCLKDFSFQDVLPFLPDQNQLMSYLGRTPCSEAGFLGFNEKHPNLNDFLERMESLYLTGEIFTKEQWHDSWLWDEIREEFEDKGILFKNISIDLLNCSHPFVNTGLGKIFDHLKGPQRKEFGKSFSEDYVKN